MTTLVGYHFEYKKVPQSSKLYTPINTQLPFENSSSPIRMGSTPNKKKNTAICLLHKPIWIVLHIYPSLRVRGSMQLQMTRQVDLSTGLPVFPTNLFLVRTSSPHQLVVKTCGRDRERGHCNFRFGKKIFSAVLRHFFFLSSCWTLRRVSLQVLPCSTRRKKCFLSEKSVDVQWLRAFLVADYGSGGGWG